MSYLVSGEHCRVTSDTPLWCPIARASYDGQCGCTKSLVTVVSAILRQPPVADTGVEWFARLVQQVTGKTGEELVPLLESSRARQGRDAAQSKRQIAPPERKTSGPVTRAVRASAVTDAGVESQFYPEGEEGEEEDVPLVSKGNKRTTMTVDDESDSDDAEEKEEKNDETYKPPTTRVSTSKNKSNGNNSTASAPSKYRPSILHEAFT